MRYLIVIGNGFSIDLMSHIKKSEDIPLGNLFSYGDKLRWPGEGRTSFLSFRNTPNLWILGVRSNNPPAVNNEIVENIITCANSYYSKPLAKRSFASATKRDIYLNAYKELTVYLKYLFSRFDSLVGFDLDVMETWPWAIFLKKLNDDVSVDSVDIINFNYDLWLERVLFSLDIDYNIETIGEQKEAKFSIAKPHGSISFIHKAKSPVGVFSVNYESDIVEGEPQDFKISMDDTNANTPIVPLIPPAGDSSRFGATWAGRIRLDAESKADRIRDDDRVLICGLSYWHVDRLELDSILLKLPESVEVCLINPSPPATFDAVLASLFDKYEHATSMQNYLEVRS